MYQYGRQSKFSSKCLWMSPVLMPPPPQKKKSLKQLLVRHTCNAISLVPNLSPYVVLVSTIVT